MKMSNSKHSQRSNVKRVTKQMRNWKFATVNVLSASDVFLSLRVLTSMHARKFGYLLFSGI